MSHTTSSELSEALAAVLGDDGQAVSWPGSESYDDDNNSYFSAFENELKPSYIVKPSSVKQVQGLITTLLQYALAGSYRIAVRSGGHTPFAGSANIQGGVTIDMRRLKCIKLSEDKSQVEIGVGETWETVYAELDKHGLTTGGARSARVGVAGSILGGALSIFSSKVGFACDLVTEFNIVLASGELIRASASEKPDLWTALKGGLNNFGIVTSFTMKVFKSEDIWGGILYYAPECFPQLLQNACELLKNETDDDIHFMCSAGYGFGHQVSTCVMYDTQGRIDSPSLQRFTAIQPQMEQLGTIRTSNHLGFSQELSNFTNMGARQYWASISIKPDSALIERFYELWQQTLATIKDAEGFVFSFGFHPLTKRMLEISAKAGANAMDIPPSEGPLFVVLINPSWALPKDDDRIFKAIEDMVAEFRRLAIEKGALHRYIFTNYASHKDDALAGYGTASLDRLRETSQKYDPEGIFQTCVPGGFKLFK